MTKRTTIVALLLTASISAVGAVDPWDAATDDYPGSAFRLWWFNSPRYSTGPTTMLYSVRNTTDQNMNFRVECSLNNPRLSIHSVNSEWIDNVALNQRGFGEADLAGFVDAPPSGMHCRVTDAKPTPTPVPDYHAGIAVPTADFSGISLTLNYRLTNSLPSNTDYQIECVTWSIHFQRPMYVSRQWLVDVPGGTVIEGRVYFPRGHELPEVSWSCRIVGARIGQLGH